MAHTAQTAQQPETWVIVPTYNEADNINELLTQLLALPVNLGVIVVDDGSPDGTGVLADRWSAAHPGRVHAIHRAGKLGLGTAYIAGFKHALTMPPSNAQRIMTMDADFSHNPRYIPAMLDLSETKQIVIGSRYVAGGGTLNWPLWRKVMSAGANTFAHIMLGLEARDTTAGFRVYHRAVLESIPLDDLFSNGYSFLVELLYMCQRQGWEIGEVPILFEDRRHGTTKISQSEIIKGMATVFKLFGRRIRKIETERKTETGV